MHRFAGGLLLAALVSPAGAFAPDLSSLDAVPLRLVQAPLEKAIEQAQHKSPLKFAVHAPLSLSLADGAWDAVDATTDRWRARVRSPGAQSLNFEFARFHLPEGAALYIYDAAGSLVQGPYTAQQQTPDGKLWTALVLGDLAVLELRVPHGLRDQAALELANVNHGFRGFGKDDWLIGAKSASCNVDVVCPQGNAWRKEIRSVARISIGGDTFCSGQLMNNVASNNALLFITANHCEINQTPSTPASSVVFYWNYQASQCGGDRDGSLDQNQTGAQFVADNRTYDFTLLRLNQPPVAHDPSAYFAGWNANPVAPRSGVTIHHPSADEKALSIYDTPATRDDSACIEGSSQGCTRAVNAWGVMWQEGTTEFGSSGGGLWDQNHFVVGWLSGGPTEQCESGPDEFARMDGALVNGLKASLDPGNTGAMTVCGREIGDGGNRCPIAAGDAISVDKGSAETPVNVLANDSDPNNDGMTITAITQGNRGGTVAIRGTQVGYTPAPTFTGIETFTYTLSDGRGGIGIATVTANVVVPGGGGGGDGGGGGGGALSPWLLMLPALLRSRRRPEGRPARRQ